MGIKYGNIVSDDSSHLQTKTCLGANLYTKLKCNGKRQFETNIKGEDEPENVTYQLKKHTIVNERIDWKYSTVNTEIIPFMKNTLSI